MQCHFTHAEIDEGVGGIVSVAEPARMACPETALFWCEIPIKLKMEMFASFASHKSSRTNATDWVVLEYHRFLNNSWLYGT